MYRGEHGNLRLQSLQIESQAHYEDFKNNTQIGFEVFKQNQCDASAGEYYWLLGL